MPCSTDNRSMALDVEVLRANITTWVDTSMRESPHDLTRQPNFKARQLDKQRKISIFARVNRQNEIEVRCGHQFSAMNLKNVPGG